MMPGVLLEIAAASVDDCVTAQAGGADRVELNCALQLGGLTPPLGMVQTALNRCRLPLIAMIRPRPGGFCYSALDAEVMGRDADTLLTVGATGLAFGFLQEDGRVDLPRCRAFISRASGAELVFHRAFDLVPDRSTALEEIIDLGINRVMTSGGAPDALRGVREIGDLVEQADGRIEILPAGGINMDTVEEILSGTGCTQIHGSLSSPKADPSSALRPTVRFSAGNISNESVPCTDIDLVERMRAYLDRRTENHS